MHRGYSQFTQRGLAVAVIAIASPDDAAAFCGRRGFAFCCLSDLSQAAYRAYGLGRGEVSQVFNPQALMAGFAAALQGYDGGIPSGDPWQMPGVFLIDRNGIVRYAHRNTRIDDHPRLPALLMAIDLALESK